MKHDFSDNIGIAISYLNQTRRHMLAKRLRGYEVAGPATMILLSIRRYPGVSQDFHASKLGFDKATVARSAEKMESLGYITREVSPEDRRQYRLLLTDGGTVICKKIQEALEEWSAMLTAQLSAEETREALRLMTIMADGVEL